MDLKEFENQLKIDLDFISDQLSEDKSPSEDDVDGIMGYGMQLAGIIAFLGKVMVDAEKLLNKKELIFMNEHEELWKQTTVLKKLMQGNLADYYAYVLLADRYSSACTHKMDFYRSILSYRKQEMAMALMQPKQS